jgi:hypothetical protein
MPIPADRLALAKRRIKNVLNVRLSATTRQLESKIAESGPNPQRCDPHVISQAIREMRKDVELSVYTHPQLGNNFFHLSAQEKNNKSRKALSQRQEKLNGLYTDYIRLVKDDPKICGDALELVMRNSFKQAPMYFELGSKANPLLSYGDRKIPGALDGTFLLSQQGLLLAVETKNIREWIYPSAAELWALLNKANVISSASCPILPILICRKIPYYTRVAFKQLGVLGFEVHHQYFDPIAESRLEQIKHVDGFGFHDIKTDLTPPPKLISFLKETVVEHGKTYAEQFLKNKQLLDEFAPKLSLESTKSGERQESWKTIKRRLNIYTDLDLHE